jgi:hypothetical protein
LKPERAIKRILLNTQNLSCGVANIDKPGKEEGPGIRAECEAYLKTKRREQGVVGLCKRKEGGKKRARGEQQRRSYTL